MKTLSVLGVTGSIGMQTVDVVKNHPDLFQIIGVSAGHNIKKLIEVIETVHPKYVCVMDQKDAQQLQSQYPSLTIYYGFS